MAEEFFRQSQQQPAMLRPGFDLRDMSRELERMGPMGAGPKEDWAADFMRQGPMGPQQQPQDFGEFEKVFNRHAGPQAHGEFVLPSFGGEECFSWRNKSA